MNRTTTIGLCEYFISSFRTKMVLAKAEYEHFEKMKQQYEKLKKIAVNAKKGSSLTWQMQEYPEQKLFNVVIEK